MFDVLNQDISEDKTYDSYKPMLTLAELLGDAVAALEKNIIELEEDMDIFDQKEKQISEFRSKQIGFIFQFHHLLPEFTAIENVMIASMIAGQPDKSKAEELLTEVGLKERINHKPSELSGGEAQRVAIARALINSPKLILADEPTGNLDTENANSIIDLIFRLREKYRQTFVIVTHNEEFARNCDIIISLKDGIVVN